MWPGAVAGRPDVADHLATTDPGPLTDREPALVRVGRHHPVPVVDERDAPVPTLPTGEDDGPGLDRTDRRPRPGTQVDAPVHPAPPRAVLGGHRRAHRPGVATAGDTWRRRGGRARRALSRARCSCLLLTPCLRAPRLLLAPCFGRPASFLLLLTDQRGELLLLVLEIVALASEVLCPLPRVSGRQRARSPQVLGLGQHHLLFRQLLLQLALLGHDDRTLRRYHRLRGRQALEVDLIAQHDALEQFGPGDDLLGHLRTQQRLEREIRSLLEAVRDPVGERLLEDEAFLLDLGEALLGVPHGDPLAFDPGGDLVDDALDRRQALLGVGELLAAAGDLTLSILQLSADPFQR